jgi:hypothetical protein
MRGWFASGNWWTVLQRFIEVGFQAVDGMVGSEGYESKTNSASTYEAWTKAVRLDTHNMLLAIAISTPK